MNGGHILLQQDGAPPCVIFQPDGSNDVQLLTVPHSVGDISWDHC